MKVEIEEKGNDSTIVSVEAEAVSIIVDNVKYVIKKSTFVGIVLVRLDDEADDLLSIRPIKHNAISIK
jgi:hypothetical protein